MRGDGGIAKCVDMGYKPWTSAADELHQACVRMVRADFCGDGVPFTVDGTAIDVQDWTGVQTPTTSMTWEAHFADAINEVVVATRLTSPEAR